MSATKRLRRAKPHTPSGNIAFVISHPVRYRMLVILNERVASPVELSRELGVNLGDASYHCRELRDRGLIEEVDSRPVRGSTEHFYRAIQRVAVTAEEYAELSEDARRDFNQHTLQLFVAQASVALDAGTMIERHDHHFSHIPGVVDEEGWKALAALFIEFEEKMFEVMGESANRLAEGDAGEPISILGAMTFFEVPTGKEFRLPQGGESAGSD